MTALVWGGPGDKEYETGIDRAVLNVVNDTPRAWNGIVSLTENVSGGEVESYYYDGRKYMDVILGESFQATLEAFSEPSNFYFCNGQRELGYGLFATNQPRKPFGLTWRTQIGNDLTEDAGYLLHLAWNLTAAPAEKASTTRGADNALTARSWTIYGADPYPADTPYADYRATAHFVIDSRAEPPFLGYVEDALYGTATGDPWWPTQRELITMMNTGMWT